MAVVNHAKREINAKIVYFGQENAGKATSLRYLFNRIRPEVRGEMKAMKAGDDSLLFFDFVPFEISSINSYRVRFHLYTLTGTVRNEAAWRMVLKGADGLVLVADLASPLDTMQQEVARLREFLSAYGTGLDEVPTVLQMNRSDLATTRQLAEFSEFPGLERIQGVPSCATNGAGVLDVLSSLSRLVMDRLKQMDMEPPADMDIEESTSDELFSESLPEEQPLFAADASTAEPESESEQVPFSPTTSAVPFVSLKGEPVTEGATVRIPLSLVLGGETKSLIVSVSIATDD